MMRIYALLSLLFLTTISIAQPTTYPVNGVDDERDRTYAFTNATVQVDYQTKIENATLLISKGKIVEVGIGISIPTDAVVQDMAGKFIYPSFVEIYGSYGLPKEKKKKNNDSGPQMVSNKKGAYGWNQAITPEYHTDEIFTADKASAKKLRQFGFGAVLSHHKDGIARGTGSLFSLKDASENEVVIQGKASAHYSFSKGTSTQDYPGSLMGSIALIRQTFYDAIWYKDQKEEYNVSLVSWNENQNLPQIFEANDNLNILRADKIAKEFGTKYIYKGNGKEYQRVDAIKGTGSQLIVPINFPKAYNVDDPYDADLVTLADMMHWEQAPANLARLERAGIDFAITSSGSESAKEFSKNLQKAVKYGLNESTALKALTYTPANMLGAYNELGSLQKGKRANFIITSKSMFDKETVVYQNWVDGEQYIVSETDFKDVRGNYNLTIDGKAYKLALNGKVDAPSANLQVGTDTTKKKKVDFVRTGRTVSLAFNDGTKEKQTFTRLSGMISEDGKKWNGDGQLSNGKWVSWSAVYSGEAKEKKKEDKEEKPVEYGEVRYPFLSYGNTTVPKQETYLLKNATVWTNGDKGILENTDVLIKDGKIAAVGSGLSSNGAKEVDATGKHIASGIIDEHSHIAISRGVNEWTQASSAEVCICDVINSEDVNLYRQLAGGVTGAQLLHGSANPIGGQSGLIKFRFGHIPEDMKIQNTDGFIKFALGENVKQSNWGPKNTVRYPQTRMGVEQTFYNYFTKAQEYEKEWAIYNGLSSKAKASATPPRKDIELETLLQILNKERFITCHSYVQSEINMLMSVADTFGFTMGTFTHILEGYKVADKMKAHGVNASTFSDWWAYKYEVIDAIPYNASILVNMGINTAINSDDAEMGRRLNQEAAKGIKYGGMTEEEAWKMVTLNPAKMLHIDDRTGSIQKGMDADVVIWSDNPLSIYAKAEKTFVDGVCYYDMEDDKKKRTWIADERNRLIQKMIVAKSNGEPTQKPKKKDNSAYGCVRGHKHGW